ncbi:cuticle protein 16.8-like [Galendromus occidentalis]|uniref:Cuticle protein 16.8-like n=1 Tax=Galendromus occidentalis TaxID=34638 RepID=A0AAJ7L5B0_9ACAR|nr:cuticle protein 16.8-like [Galendromus occidentalis]
MCLCLGLLAPVRAQKIFESNYETPNAKHYRSEDGLGNFNFGYDIDEGSSGSFRRESGNAQGVRQGSYGFREADGRVRVVNWIADSYGFRVSIRTNEPGVVASSPADASFNGAPHVYSKDTLGVPLPTEDKTHDFAPPSNSIEQKPTYQRAPAVYAKPVFGARIPYAAQSPKEFDKAGSSRATVFTPYSVHSF